MIIDVSKRMSTNHILMAYTVPPVYGKIGGWFFVALLTFIKTQMAGKFFDCLFGVVPVVVKIRFAFGSFSIPPYSPK